MISIIVPIYKAEFFISRCVDSIIAQIYEDWELLLIDDGSPDRSGEICDEYAQRDHRIKTFHKKNGGVSSARNFGLDCAKGDLITFVDADDYILPFFLENLICCADCDLIISGSKRFGKENTAYLIPEDRVYDNSSFVMKVFECNPLDYIYLCCISYPWGKILKRSIIESNSLRFNTDMKLSEDTCFMLQYLKYIKSIRFLKGGDYMYYTTDNLKAHLRMSFSEYQIHIESLKKCLDSLESAFPIDATKYFDQMCPMYFNALFSYISTSDYGQIRETLNKFLKYNTIDMNVLMKQMTSKKRIIIKISMHNSLVLYLVCKVLLNR